jgi:hypothetical protein
LPVQAASRSIVGMSQLSQFALFVSCVEGSLVTRYGTRTFIGAERATDDRRRVDYHPDQVVAIPVDEYRKFRREYLRALRDGSLVERTADEWQRQQQPASTAAAPTDDTGQGTARALKAHGDKPNDDPARRRLDG